MQSDYVCSFCLIHFKSQYNLKAHENGSKKCLANRGLKLETKNQCIVCNLSFFTKHKLKLHEDVCRNFLQHQHINEILEKNKIIDTDLQRLKFRIENETNEKEGLMLQINGFKKDIELSETKIGEYNNLITELKREEVVDKIFRVYLDVYGKNGISKMVLGTMIPLINSHLKILLSDTCDFDLEMRMNDKNEIEFWMIDCESGVEKPLASGSGYEKTVSSLALRCVLSKVCSLPKPNIIIFDEVTGKVSNDNLDRLGMFFDKLKTLFEHIWVISHNPYVQDWADHIVRVEKTDNISKVLEPNE
jgi:DNA repair exonuclease SbcCD ATPase subunit